MAYSIVGKKNFAMRIILHSAVSFEMLIFKVTSLIKRIGKPEDPKSEWIFSEIVRVTKSFLITIETEN
jgi:hypothetical protein